MKWLFSKHIVLLVIAAAMLVFAIRFFETGFNTGQLAAKVYITIIGAIFLMVGAYTATQLIWRKTIIQYQEKNSDASVQPNDLLTERESEILKAIACGMTNKEIGALLFVSENTVKNISIIFTSSWM